MILLGGSWSWSNRACSLAVVRRAQRTCVSASKSDDVGAIGTAAIALGLVSNPVVLYSEYTLKTTGAGLPPGPGGIYGAAGTLKFYTASYRSSMQSKI